MNQIADEILSYLGIHEDEYLMHYGMPRRSGRYPWGSGDNPYQRSSDFLARVDELKAQGFRTEAEIREALGGISSDDYRLYMRNANYERKLQENARIASLKADNKSNVEIGKIMGMNESVIRSRLKEIEKHEKTKDEKVADILKEALESKKIIDIGEAVSYEIGTNATTLSHAAYILQNEGYNFYSLEIRNATNPNHMIKYQVLARDDISYDYVKNHTNEIESIRTYTAKDIPKQGFLKQYPSSIDSGRIDICYGDHGGTAKDGVIEIRPGVADLNLGNSHYAQVRILVDGTHYMKGMAVYSNDIPEGKDIVFNTNKMSGTPMTSVLKGIKDDPINPFGAEIKDFGQSTYIGKDGKEHLSAINKLKEEGDWDTQSKNLSSQFLSKQPIHVIESQLKKTYDQYEQEYNDISKITNPVIKKQMLKDFAGSLDSATVHMKATPFPGQTTKVILPITSLKDDEVYAPTYKNGEKLALVRFPHAGIFEIPIVTVNNNNPDAKSTLGQVSDAIGINSKVASQLSGADFDGDTVIAIPTHNGITTINASKPLKDLEGFEPKIEYAKVPGMTVMSEKNKQNQMGQVSNLITDMTLSGAPEEDIVKAVRHSMVVIDAVKHELNYKQSEIDNDIKGLKKKYQGGGGANTLLSKRKRSFDIPETRGSGKYNKETGKMEYQESGRYYIDPKKKTGITASDGYLDKETGKIKFGLTEKYLDEETGRERTRKTGEYLYLDPDDPRITRAKSKTPPKLLNYTDDLRTLSSGTEQENLYADYGNKLKALSRKAMNDSIDISTKDYYKKTAEEAYKTEVESIQAKIGLAQMNAPRERKAQALANSIIQEQKKANPELVGDKDMLRKLSNNAIKVAREQVGASRKNRVVDITDKEWAAIQAGAVHKTTVEQIWKYGNQEDLKQRAMPIGGSRVLNGSEISKIRSMYASGKTYSEIAEALGVSTSTIAEHV